MFYRIILVTLTGILCHGASLAQSDENWIRVNVNNKGSNQTKGVYFYWKMTTNNKTNDLMAVYRIVNENAVDVYVDCEATWQCESGQGKTTDNKARKFVSAHSTVVEEFSKTYRYPCTSGSTPTAVAMKVEVDYANAD